MTKEETVKVNLELPSELSLPLHGKYLAARRDFTVKYGKTDKYSQVAEIFVGAQKLIDSAEVIFPDGSRVTVKPDDNWETVKPKVAYVIGEMVRKWVEDEIYIPLPSSETPSTEDPSTNSD